MFSLINKLNYFSKNSHFPVSASASQEITKPEWRDHMQRLTSGQYADYKAAKEHVKRSGFDGATTVDDMQSILDALKSNLNPWL